MPTAEEEARSWAVTASAPRRPGLWRYALTSFTSPKRLWRRPKTKRMAAAGSQAGTTSSEVTFVQTRMQWRIAGHKLFLENPV